MARLVENPAIQIPLGWKLFHKKRKRDDSKVNLTVFEKLIGLSLKEIVSDENDNPNKTTPIIALTANVISGAKEMYMEAGFTDFMTKPINIERLNDMLKKYL